MSLVAYGGSSDEEEGEDEHQDGGGKVELLSPNSTTLQNGSNVAFLKLPQPKQSVNHTIEEVQDEFLKKKEQPTEKKPSKPRIKISVPSLAEFDSDDEDDAKEAATKPIPKASGLFGLLPPPKGTPLSNKSFIPNVLTRKPPVKPKPKKLAQPKTVVRDTENTESDDEDIMKDIPETFDEETWKTVCGPKKKPQKRTFIESETLQVPRTDIEIAPEAPKPYDGLDNEAFKQLVGSSKRRKENIKLIDINEEEVLPDKDLWLTKSLTDPSMVPKEEIEEPVNDTCRRKHHITYLAQQAKANEQELQSQWSQNKYNRKLTQSKYGF